ncbi:hypothetical protein COE30_21330 [Bacillus cereus]|nr:hypothetical protein COE30_21330 [Bacillus cereus]
MTFSEFLNGVPPHAHQAKILKYPQNENFISLQLFMRIQPIFFVLGKSVFLNLMVMGYSPKNVNLQR